MKTLLVRSEHYAAASIPKQCIHRACNCVIVIGFKVLICHLLKLPGHPMDACWRRVRVYLTMSSACGMPIREWNCAPLRDTPAWSTAWPGHPMDACWHWVPETRPSACGMPPQDNKEVFLKAIQTKSRASPIPLTVICSPRKPEMILSGSGEPIAGKRSQF